MKFWDRVAIVEKLIDLEHEIFSSPTTVVLVGAGASKDAGFPICADLKSIDYVSPFRDSLSPEAREAFDWLHRQPDTVEVALAKALAEKDEVKSEGMLSFYEEIFVRAETASAVFSRWEYMFKLVIALSTSSRTHPVFITFNHDLILEYAGSGRMGYNYGTLSNKLYCRASQQHPKLNTPRYDYSILKLHGSFNMLVCDECERIMSWADYTWQWKGSPCSACETGFVHPLYIPPTPEKNYDPLRLSWLDAEAALRRAAEIIVIGYSLPSYDQEAVKLLEAAPADAPIYVVDKYAASVAPRYADLPPGKKLFRSSSARDFCDAFFSGEKLGIGFQDFSCLQEQHNDR